MTLGDAINAHPIIWSLLVFACFVVMVKAFLARKELPYRPLRMMRRACPSCGTDRRDGNSPGTNE